MVPKKGIFCSGDSRITCRSTVRRVGVPTALSHEAKSGPFSAGTSVPTEDAHRPRHKRKSSKFPANDHAKHQLVRMTIFPSLFT